MYRYRQNGFCGDTDKARLPSSQPLVHAKAYCSSDTRKIFYLLRTSVLEQYMSKGQRAAFSNTSVYSSRNNDQNKLAVDIKGGYEYL